MRVVQAPLPASGPGGAPPSVPVPANVFTNAAVARADKIGAITVVLIDSLNTPFTDMAYARQQLIKFLGTITPNDRVAVYALGQQLVVLHDFTSDVNALLRVLQKHQIYMGTELVDSMPDPADTGDPEMDAFLDEATQRIADFQVNDRVTRTLGAIQAIAEHVAAIPGRKNLVWISGGFPLTMGMDQMSIGSARESRVFSGELQETARALTASQLAIYPVDAHGVAVDSTYSVAAAPKTLRGGQLPPGGPSKYLESIHQSQDAMKAIAERTGGRAYFNSNDLTGAIRKAIDDSRVTYVLAYYPTHNSWDSKFRPLKVTVKRPGLDVRYRTGYFAFPDRPVTEQSRRAALLEALTTPLDAAGLGVTIRLAPDTPKPGALRLLLDVDPRQVAFTKQGDTWTAMIDVLYARQDAADHKPAVTTDTFNLSFSQQQYEEAMRIGLHAARDFDPAQARYVLKVVVRDANNGNVGAVTARLEAGK